MTTMDIAAHNPNAASFRRVMDAFPSEAAARRLLVKEPQVLRPRPAEQCWRRRAAVVEQRCWRRRAAELPTRPRVAQVDGVAARSLTSGRRPGKR